MSKVVIAGGSGFVGRALSDLLVKLGHEVVVLSRRAEAPPGARGVKWDGETLGAWAQELEGAAGVVNLTGSSISVKWTPAARREIVESRVRSAQVIAQAIRMAKDAPPVWVNASATGFYGDRGSQELDERSAPGGKGDFLVDTTFAWEETVRREDVGATRKCLVRIGLVLGRDGGALPRLASLARMFLGGHHGGGDQYMSWIHVDDLARLVNFCMVNEVPEVVNGVGPMPVTNRYFMASVRAILGRPWSPPVPGFILSLGNALFGLPDPSLVLNGQRVFPRAAQEAGFQFTYAELREALIPLLR